MLSSKQNLIQMEDIKEYGVKKYEFKSMSLEERNEQRPHTEEVVTVEAKVSSLEKDMIDRLLKKSDELSGNLAKLEIQFEKTQSSMQESIKKTSEESYRRGLEEGKNHARNELESQINEEREKIVQSIVTLDNVLKSNQSHLQHLEKELSGIAVDMAKEVIVKEIDSNSQKVALELTKSLLSSIMDANQISIKVNPIDYVYIKENLKDVEKIEIEADNAISRGGVVISSNIGHLDGNVMARYKMLKQSVLESMHESLKE